MSVLTTVLMASWTVLVAMAPYLLLGFFVAGLLSVVISPEWVERHLGRGSFSEIFKAALFGVPLPLCSCGVLPVAASLRRHGAGKGATTAFLLSTPQTGVDSIAITWALLGPVLAILRPIVALLTGVFGGFLVRIIDGKEERREAEEMAPMEISCSGGEGAAEVSCCSSGSSGDESTPSESALLRGLRYGFSTLPRDIGRALLIGIVLSGLISVLLKPEMIEAAGISGWVAYPIAMLVGIPLYVCATASTPIAAGLIAAGISPGAALVFLISGPATNMAALTTLLKILGRRVVVVYLATVVVASMVTGILVDLLLRSEIGEIPAKSMLEHSHGTGGFGVGEFSAVLLLIMLGFALRPVRKPERKEAEPQMEIEIGGMRCAGCSGAIERNLAAMTGVEEVHVRLEEGRALLRAKGLDPAEILRTIEDLGYSATIRESMLTGTSNRCYCGDDD